MIYENSSFVSPNSIVREIWGKADTALFIFAGAAAEFSLNKAVDWLYFTGRLPADPIGRLFSTVEYARHIIFSDKEKALNAIDSMSSIHAHVEQNRGYKIPDWAYRDVLYMLIYYSVASYELLERKLTNDEKEEIINVFIRVGKRMNIPDLPDNYNDWQTSYTNHLKEDLVKSNFTIDLYKQYRKHLDAIRYYILVKVQSLLVSKHVLHLLEIQQSRTFPLVISFYKFTRTIRINNFLKSFLLPKKYKERIKRLDIV